MFRTVGVTLETASVDSVRMGQALGALSSMSGQSNSFEEHTQSYISHYLQVSLTLICQMVLPPVQHNT